MDSYFRNHLALLARTVLAAGAIFSLFAACTANSADSSARSRWIEAGENQERRGNNDAAIDAYKRALRDEPALDAEVFITLARLHREEADFDAASVWLERARKANSVTAPPRDDLRAGVLREFGWIHFRQGDYDRAARFAERALAIRPAKSPRGRLEVADSLNLKGLVHRDTNEYAEARAAFDQALLVLAGAPHQRDRLLAQIYTNLGGLDYYEANYSDAVSRFRTALEVQRHALAVGHPDFGNTLNNLALAHQQLGDLEQAAAIYEQALKIKIAAYGRDNPRVGSTLHNMGIIAEERGDGKRAQALYERSLNIYQTAFGDNHPGVAMNLTQLGVLASRAGDKGRAIDMLNRAVGIMENVHGVDSTWIAEPLVRLASISGSVGKNDATHALFLRSIRIATRANERNLLADAYAAYAEHLANQGQTPAAILLGKLAVRTIESVRAELTPLGATLNRSYLGEREPAYRMLAHQLLQSDRLDEASEVLRLLKHDEYLRFTHHTVAMGAKQSRLELTRAEAAAANQLNGASTASFVNALASLPESKGSVISNDAESIHKVAANAVRVQYLVAGDMLSALVTGAGSRFAVSVAVSEASLLSFVSSYQRALRDPHSDPLPQAQQLYEWMLQPLEDKLAAQPIDTLLLSLDGPLRYVPVAAIHDGERWTAERFSTIRYSSASRSSVAQPASADRLKGATMAAFGVSEAEGFAPLPQVANELRALVDSGGLHARAMLPGELYLDAEFTLQNFVSALASGYPLVHLASHFVLQPGSLHDSYLVIGGGLRLTLEQLRAGDYSFDNVQLLTLSACDTAAATENAYGREIDGLGILAQEKGARAVLASLWPVADRSTQRFMQTFYRLLVRERKTTAAALRATQVSLITGNRAAARAATGYRLARAPRRQAAAPYAHPFYWAPFVLMQFDP